MPSPNLGLLTGLVRWRRSFFGKIILQVEERTYLATKWRDARIGELGKLESYHEWLKTRSPPPSPRKK